MLALSMWLKSSSDSSSRVKNIDSITTIPIAASKDQRSGYQVDYHGLYWISLNSFSHFFSYFADTSTLQDNADSS